MIVGPWYEAQALVPGTHLYRKDPLGNTIAYIEGKEGSPYTCNVIPLDVGNMYSTPKFQRDFPGDMDVVHAKAWCDRILIQEKWRVLDCIPRMASPWKEATNHWRRDITIGLVREEGKKPTLAFVTPDDNGWSWGIVTGWEHRVTFSGKCGTKEDAMARADRRLSQEGWSLP